jgi:ABC transporter substrate binding protein
MLYGASPAFRPDTDPSDRAIAAGLRDHGYVVGQNVVVEFRSALGGGADRFQVLAAELVGLGVDVILTTTEIGASAAATRTIPIVMAGASTDAVATGFVASLARPGGNITGVTLGDLAGKRLELLKEALPALRSVVALHGDLSIPFVAQWLRATEAAARRLGLVIHPARLPLDTGEWEQVFDTVNRRQIGAATIHEAPRFELHRERLAALALKHRLTDGPHVPEPSRSGRPHVIHGRPRGDLPARGQSHRENPQGGQARRSARRGADQVSVRAQPQDREGARPDDPAVGAGASR